MALNPLNSLETFQGYLSAFNDLARADRFMVYITPPSGLMFNFNGNPLNFLSEIKTSVLGATGLTFQCEAAELPGRTMATYEARTYGPSVKFPFQGVYNDFNLTFFCTGNSGPVPDTGLWEKTYFDNWMELINPADDDTNSGQFNIGYQDDYVTNVTVVHFDTNGLPTYGVTYQRCWPIQVDHLPLDWSNDSIMRLNVTFAYKKWENINTAIFNSL